MVGSARLLIRASAGLAAGYAAAGERERARELADGAAAQMQSILSQSATVTLECSLAQLHLLLAVAELRLGRREQAIDCLDRARATGWQDWRWLLADPELRPLQTHPVFVSFVEMLQSAPAIDMPIPWHAVSASTARARA